MSTVTSADGTTIAYETAGQGPALILVDGAFCSRAFGPMPALAKELADRFTVYTYDRRGRGDSGDTKPYAVEREIADIEALIDVAGGAAYVHGTSSGAVLALRAAAALPGKVTKVAAYEPPMVVDNTRKPPPADYLAQVSAKIAAGRNGDAVAFFMTKMVGAPAFAPVMMRLIPGVWSKLKRGAPTLPYDFAILGDTQMGTGLPAELVKALGSIDVPTLVADGGKSPEYMHHAADAVAAAVSGAARDTLPEQTHQVKATAIAPVLAAFYQAGES
jgi:pimeloyl-ACP methyl ester carboxylesterase